MLRFSSSTLIGNVNLVDAFEILKMLIGDLIIIIIFFYFEFCIVVVNLNRSLSYNRRRFASTVTLASRYVFTYFDASTFFTIFIFYVDVHRALYGVLVRRIKTSSTAKATMTHVWLVSFGHVYRYMRWPAYCLFHLRLGNQTSMLVGAFFYFWTVRRSGWRLVSCQSVLHLTLVTLCHRRAWGLWRLRDREIYRSGLALFTVIVVSNLVEK